MASLEWITLATDGTVDTARHLGLDDWKAIAGSDPDGRHCPRAKRNDDKAIAAIRLS